MQRGVLGMAHTRFVALCSVHIESPTSTRSPRANGKELPLAIADATADFKKSMASRDGGSERWWLYAVERRTSLEPCAHWACEWSKVSDQQVGSVHELHMLQLCQLSMSANRGSCSVPDCCYDRGGGCPPKTKIPHSRCFVIRELLEQ